MFAQHALLKLKAFFKKYSENNVYWGTATLNDVIQRPLHLTKCTTWVAISENGIIGPYWYEDRNGKSQL